MKSNVRKLKQIAVTGPGRIYAICEDGTFWTAEPCAGIQPQWIPLVGPPEGTPMPRHEETLEEFAERLRRSGGRQMIIGPKAFGNDR